MSKEYINNGEQTRESKKRSGKGVAILLIIFIILVLITTAILGAHLYKMATRDQYTVDLELNGPEGSIELFRIQYENELGEITVQGVNGEAVVAPGTEVTYDIRLRNNDDVIIDFFMTPTVDFLTDDPVPVEFKVVDGNGNYLLGGDDEWVKAEDMNALAHKGSVHPGEIYTYHILWRWVFEVSPEQDAEDTFLGNQNGIAVPGVSVGISTHSVANVTPVKGNHHLGHVFGKNFGCCWCCYLVWFLMIVCLVLVIWIWRLQKKLKNLEQVVDEYNETFNVAGLEEIDRIS